MALEALYPLARQHPWYSGRFQSDGSLPVLTKADLYALLQGCEHDPFYAHNTYWSPSGGSGSAPPIYFPCAVEENIQQRQRLSEWLRSEGILGPQVVALNLFSSRTMYRSCEIFVDYVQMCGGTVLPATYQAKDADIVELYRRFGANTLMGSPGRLVQLAHHAAMPFERILYASETLSAGAQALLDQRFSRPLWSSVMGAAEGGVWGFSRPQDDRDVFWAPRQLVHLEVIEADADGFGRVIVSNLLRRRHPLLRYDSGDRGRLLPGYHPELVGLQLAGRHGRSFQFSSQCYDLADFAEVVAGAASYQFVLRFEHCDCLTLRLVATPEAAQHSLQLLRQVVRANPLINHVSVELCQPEQLQRVEHSGKILPIVDLR